MAKKPKRLFNDFHNLEDALNQQCRTVGAAKKVLKSNGIEFSSSEDLNDGDLLSWEFDFNTSMLRPQRNGEPIEGYFGVDIFEAERMLDDDAE